MCNGGVAAAVSLDHGEHEDIIRGDLDALRDSFVIVLSGTLHRIRSQCGKMPIGRSVLVARSCCHLPLIRCAVAAGSVGNAKSRHLRFRLQMPGRNMQVTGTCMIVGFIYALDELKAWMTNARVTINVHASHASNKPWREPLVSLEAVQEQKLPLFTKNKR